MCPFPLHTKKDLRSFSQGSDYDSSSEFIGASDRSVTIEKVNFRHDEFDKDSVTKIGGEELIYPAINNACFLSQPYAALVGYLCIGTKNFFLEDDKANHIIEFWASPNTGSDPFIRIDGVVVLMNENFPITWDHPLQGVTNLSCIGGEIYITDYNVVPMIFNLKDLMVNGGFTFDGSTQCTQKYFSDFNINEYTLELSGDNNHPIFIQTTQSKPASAEAIGSGGNDVGLYTYQIRKVKTSGDQTGWSKATPLIPVVLSYRSPSAQYPYTKTFGADPATKSTYGIHIRFRIDNAEGYDYLEIKRTRYTLGSAPGVPGVEKLLDYRLQLQADDNYVKDIWDIGATELPLSDQAASQTLSAIKRAKAIRYFNMRIELMNIEFQSRDIPVTFSETGGKKMFPVIEKMTTASRQDGHKNPYNFAYFRSLPRGEKYGWAAEFRDGNNQLSFAIPVPENIAQSEDYQNYEMPNRRDACAAETLQFSNATVKAANPNGIVHQTHEVFDTVDSITKTATVVVNPFTGEDFHPVSQNDSSVTGHNLQINNEVRQGTAVNSEPIVAYNPKAFGLNYYSLGMALSGISAIPSYIKSFSLVRTKPARRVVAQGVAHYDIGNPSVEQFTKATNSFLLSSPDFDSGIVSIDDIITNINAGGTRYKVQCVSPLGFFSEVYNFNINQSPDAGHPEFPGLDMIHYLRVLRENGDINPGDVPSNDGGNTGVGIDSNPVGPGDGYGYTGFGKWRRRTMPTGGQVFPNASNGNQLFDIASVVSVSGLGTNSVRFPVFRVTLNSPLFDYSTGVPIPALNGFLNPLTQNWHEPMYIVNIIDTSAEVTQGNIQNYIETEHYQKIESNIGISIGTDRQEYLTVDERPADFQPEAGSVNKIIFSSLEGVEKVWYNVDGLSPALLLGVVNSINNGTFSVTFNGVSYLVDGIFETTSTPLTDTYNEIRIVFDTAFNPDPLYPDSLFRPDAGEKILVRYNSDEPVKSFGGEAVIHEAVFSPFDLKFLNDGGTDTNHTTFPAPFPFIAYNINAGFIRPSNLDFAFLPNPAIESAQTIKFLQAVPAGGSSYSYRMATMRQMLCMFTCESRIGLPYTFEIQGSASQEKFFPATNYIPRPFQWDPTKTPVLQDVPFAAQYDVDYPGEQALWYYGGFRFRPQTNLDYSSQDETHTAVSKPRVGFQEITLFCTGVAYSLPRPPNVVNAPGLRTFPATNFFVIEDDTGDIKYAYDDSTDGKGSNLYAITEKGVYWLITDKTILSTLTGDQLAAIGSTGGNAFISLYLPISKTIGMNDEFWRSAAEGYRVLQGDTTSRRTEALFFSNKISQYRLSGGQIDDLARGQNFHSKVYPEYLSQVLSGYQTKMASLYDVLHDEYWMSAQVNGTTHPIVAHAEKKSSYEGTYDYQFDQFTSFQGSTYGMRDGETYLLNQYDQPISGKPIVAFITGVSAKDLPAGKEFSRVVVSSNEKPQKIRFYNSKADYIADIEFSEINTILSPRELKDYNGFTGYIPRKVLRGLARLRNQGRECIFKIIQTGNTKFIIVTTEIGYTLLK